MSREIEIAAADGGTFAAYLATPSANARAPGILLLPPVFGIEPVIRDLADSYAKCGYVVVVPNQFWRDPEPQPMERTGGGRERALERARRVDVDVLVDDVRASVETMRAMPECNGTVVALGFCFGGRYAYLAAARLPIAAAAAFHGTQIGLCLPEKPRVPVSLHFGAEDPLTPKDEVDAIAAAVRDVPDSAVYVYPGAAHNFSLPGNPSYLPDVARLAGERTFAFFDRVRAASRA